MPFEWSGLDLEMVLVLRVMEYLILIKLTKI